MYVSLEQATKCLQLTHQTAIVLVLEVTTKLESISHYVAYVNLIISKQYSFDLSLFLAVLDVIQYFSNSYKLY